MVAVRRINPEDGVGRLFKELKGQVNALGTKASGNIVIRETLTSTDPETGVSVVFGKLPDGSTGLQQFVNDVTPPGQPSTPSAEPSLSALSVTWDGLEAPGTAQPRDYDRTEIRYRTGGEPWTLGGVFYGASTVLVPNLSPGVRYDIQLVSFDKNNNASTPSGVVSATPSAVMDSSDVADAISEVRSEAAQAAQDSATAQGAAEAAQKSANTAASEAAKASNLAAGNTRTIFASTAPTKAEDRTANILWIDTSGSPAKNIPNRWDGGKWVAMTDITAVNAAAKAAEADSAAKAAAASAAAAATAAGQAQTSANGKNKNWYTGSAPAGTAHAVGDTWFNTASGNEPNTWDGAKWVSIRDTSIAAAKSVADSASSIASGKTTSYYQNSKPTGGTYKKADTWFDTANNYALWTYDGTTWVKAQDSATAKAEAISSAAADAKKKADDALADAKTDAATKANNTLAYALGSAPRGTNVIVNGSFDQDFTGWTKEVTQTDTNYGIDTTTSRTGGRSLWTTGKGGFQQQGVPVVAGQTWEMALWYKTENTFPNNAAGGIRLQAIVNGAWIDAASGGLTMKEDWFRSSLRYVVPEGVTQIRPRFAFNYSGGAKVWIDDVELVNITAELAAASDATAKANAAQQAAITAAQADAKAQTEAAEARVAKVASDDAQAKATAAQAAALAAAKTYADAQASGAQGAALEAAKADATTKANAAQAAAIAAAALDATTKKEQAEATAALEAKRLADLALEAAKSDATTKVATKTKTWIQAAQPSNTGNVTGDTWIDSDAGNKLYVWNGAAWASAQDTAIAAAKSVADGKNKTYYQNTKPTGGTYVVGDTWFDTANNYALYTYTAPNVWTKTQDAAQALADAKTDATAKANAAQTAAVTAAAADAASKAATAESNAKTAAAADAKKKAEDAQAAALAAAKTYADAQATGASSTALESAKADATTKANAAQAAAIAAAALDATAKAEEAEASAALEAKRLADIALASAKADTVTQVATKNKTWTQTSRPALTGNIIGDTWIDTSTSGGNKLNVWNGSAWVAVQDAAIATAQGAANSALTAANGKNKIIFSTSDASGTTGYVAGDMWMKRDASGVIIGQWEFTTAWQKRTIAESVLGNLSAGKITSGTIAADRIGANTIGVTKLSVADLTNLLEDPLFTQALPSPYWTGNITDITAATDHPTVGTGNTLKITGTAGIRDVTSTKIAASPGDEFYAEVWVKPLATGMKGTVQIASTVNLVPSGNTWPSFAQIDLSALTPNVWTKISGSIKTPSNAKAVFVRLSLRENVASGDVLFAAPALRRKNGGELLVDGAIKAGSAIIADGAIGTAQIGNAQITTALIKDGQITNAKINDLNASKINAGTIGADRIGANSINATKLVLTDNSNLWPNQYFADDLSTTYHVGAAYTGTEVPPLGKCRLLSGRDHIASTASYINARYGDSFVIEAVVKRTLGEVRLGAGLWLYKSAGVATPSPYRYSAESVVVSTLANGWERRRWTITFNQASDVDATLGLLYFQIEQTTAAPTTNWLVSDTTIRRRNGGELLVDGSIKAGSAIIANGAIGTAQIGDAQITTALIKDGQITNAKINDLNASKITAGTIAADRLAANDIRAKLIAADDISASDILVSNSITAASGIIGSLDAGVISTGTLNAARLASKSITTDKLLITSSDNVIQEPDFSAGGVSWVRTANITCAVAGGRGGGNTLRFTGTTHALESRNNQPNLPVDPGASYSGSMWVRSTEALPVGNVRLFMRCFNSATSATAYSDIEIASNQKALVSNTWTEVSGLNTVGYGAVPANTINVQFYIRVTNTTAAGITDVDYVSATRKADGRLIVDGAIDGKIITGALVQSVSAPDRGIKLSDSQFVAYNDAGTETLRFDGTNAIITGAVFRTAATGSRVQLSNAGGLEVWDVEEKKVFAAGASGISAVGTVSTLAANGAGITLSPGPSTAVYSYGGPNLGRSVLQLWTGRDTTNTDLLETGPSEVFAELAQNGTPSLWMLGPSIGGETAYPRRPGAVLGYSSNGYPQVTIQAPNIKLSAVSKAGLNGEVQILQGNLSVGGSNVSTGKLGITRTNSDSTGFENHYFEPGYWEFGIQSTGQPNSATWGPGMPSLSNGLQENDMFVWESNDVIRALKGGVYHVSLAVWLGAAAHGRSFVEIKMNRDPIGTRVGIPVGEDQGCVSAVFHLRKGDTIKFISYKNTGTDYVYYYGRIGRLSATDY